jgi:hypothetical protein
MKYLLWGILVIAVICLLLQPKHSRTVSQGSCKIMGVLEIDSKRCMQHILSEEEPDMLVNLGNLGPKGGLESNGCPADRIAGEGVTFLLFSRGETSRGVEVSRADKHR